MSSASGFPLAITVMVTEALAASKSVARSSLQHIPHSLRDGESSSRKLPHSQLGMQWTIKYLPSPEPVGPDITVSASAAELRAGRDPVLAAAIAAR